MFNLSCRLKYEIQLNFIMFLSTNSFYYNIFRLILTIFPFYYVTVCSFACLRVFDWIIDIVNFILLSLGYFGFSGDILEFWSETKLSYFESSWYFQVFFLSFVTQVYSSIQAMSNFTPPLKQNSSVYSIQLIMNFEFFFPLVNGAETSSGPLSILSTLPSNHFEWLFPRPQ